MSLLRSWILILLTALALASCGSQDMLPAFSDTELEAFARDAAAEAPKLQPSEKIRVTVFGEDRLSGEYQIDPAGYVSLPLAGTLRAAGLTKIELERELAKKFSTELRSPKVTVDVASFRPLYIYGEVAKPGEYPYKGGLNVMSAIAIAGGTTYRASRSSVQIQHVGETGFREYPLSPLVPVLPGDLVRVPMRYF
jgi:protein involved in polysaccharide export with SLBB domain